MQNSITARPGFGGLPRYAWLCEGDGGDMVVLPTPPPTASPSIASIEDQAQLLEERTAFISELQSSADAEKLDLTTEIATLREAHVRSVTRTTPS